MLFDSNIIDIYNAMFEVSWRKSYKNFSILLFVYDLTIYF